MERLPEGVRDSQASHILLEFKYTESLSAAALQQTLAYDCFYPINRFIFKHFAGCLRMATIRIAFLHPWLSIHDKDKCFRENDRQICAGYAQSIREMKAGLIGNVTLVYVQGVTKIPVHHESGMNNTGVETLAGESGTESRSEQHPPAKSVSLI